MTIVTKVPNLNSSIQYRINVAETKLGVSPATIYRLDKEGTLELVKIGKRSSGITAASIAAVIEKNKVNRKCYSGALATFCAYPKALESG